jgi:GTP-binding protein
LPDSFFSEKIPVVAIVGRPNVGKSALFNKLVGRRSSIVHDLPGVTRDYVVEECVWCGKKIDLIDTGGLDFEDRDFIINQIKSQVRFAVDLSDVVIFVTDLKSGILPYDSDIAVMLKKNKVPVILCVNKCDDEKADINFYEFCSLGFGVPFGVSSVHGHGTGDLLDAVYEKVFSSQNIGINPRESLIRNISEKLPENIVHDPEKSLLFGYENNKKENLEKTNEDSSPIPIKVAIIGKPNVGKSSLVNRICGKIRSIVSNESGTTRDSLDTFVIKNSKNYIFTDTAGIRKNKSAQSEIERYSTFRTFSASKRSDVCAVIIEAKGLTEQDLKIAGISRNLGKSCIILVNKWDSEFSEEIACADPPRLSAIEFEKKIRKDMPFLSYAPVVFISAKTGRNIEKIFILLDKTHNNFRRRISTGSLNEFLAQVMFRVPPPSIKGKQLKIYYMTQADIMPPTFVFFVNKSKLFHFSYKRYIENRLRENFEFEGTPIKFVIREKGSPKDTESVSELRTCSHRLETSFSNKFC